MVSSSRPVVTISDGQLMGARANTESGTPYYAFKGIPFAKPPIGDLRFMPPQSVDPWDGVRDATYDRNICCQLQLMKASMMFHSTYLNMSIEGVSDKESAAEMSLCGNLRWLKVTEVSLYRNEMILKGVLSNIKLVVPRQLTSFEQVWGLLRALPMLFRIVRAFWKRSEDCLFLNVYTPQLPSSDSEAIDLPVLVWIHGGAFIMGSGCEAFGKMHQMLDRGIVVVSINYRLGPFGFLSLDTASAPGNAGLKDQVEALHWVQRNVSKFGGDPNRVTIYGTSAGGMSVHLLTLSPLARGLFRGAVACSGVASYGCSVKTDHVKTATAIAKLLNIEGSSTEDIALALKRVSASDLLKAFAKYSSEKVDTTLTCSLPFAPSLERPGPGAFLTELPEDIMRAGTQAAVPFISGVVANDGLLWYMYPFAVETFSLNHQRQLLMPLDLYEALSDDQRKEVGDKIVEFYCGEKGICKETEEEFIHLYGDIMFVVKMFSTCRLYASTSAAPVYMYRFCFQGRLNGSKLLLQSHPGKGPGHSDEVGYFLVPELVIPRPTLRPGDPEIEVTQKFSGVMANFVKTGKPTIPEEVNPACTEWKPITNNSVNYLNMELVFEMKDDNFGPRLQFWNDLYKMYLNAPFLPY